jgi:hypothetical protein
MHEVSWMLCLFELFSSCCWSAFSCFSCSFFLVHVSLRRCRFPSHPESTAVRQWDVCPLMRVSPWHSQVTIWVPIQAPRIVRNNGNHKSDTCLKADRKGKIYFCRRACLQPESRRLAHWVGSPLSFYLSCKSAPHPDRWVWVHSLHDWLFRKGGSLGRGSLRQGEQENSFG